MIRLRACFWIALLGWPLASTPAAGLERVAVSPDGKGFVTLPSGRPIEMWGFNYDHDRDNRLIEDYWHDEWDSVVQDFHEMKALGANVVRVHLQLGRFLPEKDGPPDARNMARLDALLRLSEEVGLYLDLTGLGCYHKPDVPPWYDALDEEGRWAVQRRFWEVVAARCAGSSAVFCYDLMNEPVVPGGKRDPGDWLGPGFGDKFFVQFITLDQRERTRPAIARAWVETLAAAIRAHDSKTLITVGLVPWSLDRPGLSSGFVPDQIAGPLDFIAVHIYPESGKVDDALETLRGFAAVGKPVVIEEMFCLNCDDDDLGQFIDRSRGLANGWIGFYWGATLDELAAEKTLGAALTRSWLELFRTKASGP